MELKLKDEGVKRREDCDVVCDFPSTLPALLSFSSFPSSRFSASPFSALPLFKDCCGSRLCHLILNGFHSSFFHTINVLFTVLLIFVHPYFVFLRLTSSCESREDFPLWTKKSSCVKHRQEVKKYHNIDCIC